MVARGASEPPEFFELIGMSTGLYAPSMTAARVGSNNPIGAAAALLVGDGSLKPAGDLLLKPLCGCGPNLRRER